MATIEQLRAELNEHHREANGLLAEKGSRTWSKKDRDAFDVAMDAADRLQAQITNTERLADKGARVDFKDARRMSPAEAKKYRSSLYAGLDVFMRTSADQWSGRDAALVANTMSTTTQTEGGFTLAPMVAGDLVDSLRDYGSVRRVAGYVRTETGVNMGWPRCDGRAETGEWIAQNISASGVDPTFGSAPVNVFKASSKIVVVPIELLQDSQIDIAGIVFNRARARIGRSCNIAFTTGTGSGEPFGLTTAATIGKSGVSGDTTAAAITWENLADLVDALDVSYLQENRATLPVQGPGPGWMLNQTVRRAVRKLKDSTGRPIWTPSYDKGMTVAGDRLLGYPVYLNNDMPSPAANAISVAFGNFSKYLVRDALEVTLFRFEDAAYAAKGQVGFLAWARAGGNLLDPSSVVTFKHSAS